MKKYKAHPTTMSNNLNSHLEIEPTEEKLKTNLH